MKLSSKELFFLGLALIICGFCGDSLLKISLLGYIAMILNGILWIIKPNLLDDSQKTTTSMRTAGFGIIALAIYFLFF